jgi:ABC-type glycerol-3-phosphate transport system substrate-binding protein
MLNIYSKNRKKSIRGADRIDLFLIFTLVILIATPVIINLFFVKHTENKEINLYLSPHFEELFGKELTENLLNEYAQQNSNPQIKIINFIDENNSLGRDPDILIFDDSRYSTLATGGLLAKISHQFFNETDFPSVTADQLAIPLVSFMDVFFYNVEILTAAGFDRPPKTREEFLNCARAISLIINTYPSDVSAVLSLGLYDSQSPSREIFSWIWASGSDFWQEKNWPILNTRTVTGDISFFGTLYREKIFAPGIFGKTGEQRLEEFITGRAAMIIASTRDIPYLRKRMGENAFGITTIPQSGLSGRYNISLSGLYAGINMNCENQEEAFNFLVFLAGKEKLFCELFNAVPGVISDIVPADYIKDDTYYSKAQDIFESSMIVQSFSGTPGAQEYENAFMEELRIFFNSTRTPLETVNAIQRRWDKITED